MKFCVIFFLVLVVSYPFDTESAKILGIFSIPSPSHYIFGSALLKELAKQGHEVTSVNVYPQKQPIKNFRDIFIEKNTKIIDDFMKTAQNGQSLNIWNEFSLIMKISENMAKNIFEHPDFRELLKSPEGKFDLIIVEAIWDDSLYGLGQHFNAPMIGVSTFGTMTGIDEVVGNSAPNSIVPNIFLPYSGKMTLLERVNNFITNLQTYIIVNYKMYYVQKELYEKHFPNAKLSFSKARTNFSLVLLNQHHSISFPRPFVTNMVEVGGLHINRKTDPLPEDLQQFLDNATEGVVYFSMGSNVKSKEFPPEKRDIFLNVFRSLKQKVLWKFEDAELPNKSENVFIRHWIPQHSVLAHPNVKVFITHGGLLSVTESIHFGVPMLGLPMFYDQPRNIENSVSRGLALSLDFRTLTEKDLRHTLDQLLNNSSFMEKAKLTSNHFHDQPLTPMKTAVYWVEYILKYGGEHLRNAGADMNIWQYYSVDVIGILLSITVFSLLILFCILKTVIVYCKNSLGVTDKKVKIN